MEKVEKEQFPQEGATLPPAVEDGGGSLGIRIT